MRKYATLKEKIATHEKLKEVLVKDGEYWNYVHPWNDEAVAKFVGGHTTWASVRDTRRKMFGNMRATIPNTGALEARITQIEDYLTRQNPNWNK